MPAQSSVSSDNVFSALVNATANWTPINPSLFEAIDWQLFLRDAHHHRVHPIAFRRVLESKVGESLETSVQVSLRECSQAPTVRSFPLVQELVRILKETRNRHLDVIPYKGPVLAQQYWGDFSLRECSDLDLLVSCREVEAAGHVLDELGYRRVTRIPQHLRPALLRNASEEQFFHPELKILVELQWSPAPRVLGVDYASEEIWVRKRQMTFANLQVTVPSAEDMLVLLAIHGWKHNWSRLLWVGDIAQVLHEGLNLDEALAIARKNGVTKIVKFAVLLAARVFGVETDAVPERAAVEKEIALALQRLSRAESCSYFGWHRSMLAVRDRNVDRLRQLTRFAFTPGIGEYTAVELPPWASAGYRLLRVARVLRLVPGKTRE
ncbi:MAG TPA: nucleotidyltransferase family protein [Terriglobales bacterium]|nr:nucleotidyltransferase family protein [Terriglobales bacterium]